MIGESSLCDIYNLPVVSPCGNKVECDEFAFNFEFDKAGLGFDDIFPDYIQPTMDASSSENFYPGLVHDKTNSTTCNDNFEIFDEILTDNDFNFNLLLSSDNNLNSIKKEPSFDDFDNLPAPLESLPDEGWYSSPSNEHPSSSSLESLQISPLGTIKDEVVDTDSGFECLRNSQIFPDADIDLQPLRPIDRPRIVSTWKVKSSLNKRAVGSALRGSHLSHHNSNTAVQGRPFGSNTAPCYNEYGSHRSNLHHKHRVNCRHNMHRQFKRKNRDYSIYATESCPPAATTPIHRHGQTERERRAQENKRMRNIENAIRTITTFKSDAYFPRDRATKERTLKATKALIHFYHSSNITIQNANLRLEIDEMKFRLSTARRLKQQQSTPFSGVNCNNSIVSSSSTNPTISRLTTHTLNSSSSAKFIQRHHSASTATNKSVY